jgi:hypothetical protein
MSMEQDIESVKILGEQIGYGHLMSIASALWRKSLKEKGYPESGAFVPTCIGLFDTEGEEIAKESSKLYDSHIDEHFNQK